MARTKRRPLAKPRPPLHDACARGNVEEVAALIKQENHQQLINMRDDPNGGGTPLHVACIYGHVEVAQILLEQGADVCAKDKLGRTPVAFCSTGRRSPALVQLLKENGAMVEGEELTKACREGDLEMAQKLTEDKDTDTKKNQQVSGSLVGLLVNYQDSSGSTPLYYACQERHYQVAHYLLDQGADWTIANARGQTPLQFANKIMQAKDISTVEQAHNLLHQVAHKDALYPQLVQAIQDQDFTKARALLQTGGALPDPVQCSSPQGTPLELVVDSNNVEFAKVLLQHGADVNYHHSYSTNPPLINAIQKKNWGMFEVLMQAKNVNPDVRDCGDNTALHWACKLGHLEMAQQLIDKGADVHEKTDDSNGGAIPLYYACKCPRNNNTRRLVELLLEKGSDPNARDFDSDHTALHSMAVATRYRVMCHSWNLGDAHDDQDEENGWDDYNTTMEMVRLLIQHGAEIDAQDYIVEPEDIDEQDGLDRTPLALAIDCENYNVAKALVHHGANVNVRYFPIPVLHSVCFFASRGGERSLDLIKLLIEKGANIHARERDHGRTSLHCACSSGHYHVVKVLLANGANLFETPADGETCLEMARTNEHLNDEPLLPNEYPSEKTALAGCVERTIQLIRACQEGNVELLKSLCCQKEDYFAHVKANDGQYIIHHVCRHGPLQAVQSLVAKGADINAKRDSDGKTPLDLAQEAGITEIVKWIQKDGASIDSSMLSAEQVNKRLFEAIEHGDSDIAKIQQLIDQAGADVNCTDEYYSARTPLYAAAAYGDLNVARLLIERGANVNACNTLGCSPLHASARRSLNVAKLLIANGANVHATDELGNTPLHVACRCRQAGITKLLLSQGANILAPNRSGKIPEVLARLHMARRAGSWTNTHNLVKAAQEGNAGLVEQYSEQSIFAQVRVPNDDAAATALSWQEVLTKTVEFVMACRTGKVDLVEDFVRLDIFLQKEIPDTAGEFVLHCVCRLGNIQAAQTLVRKGADVNATREDKKTALALAAKYGHLDIVKWLICDHVVDVLLADRFGNTPLHHACREGHLEIVQFIVSQSGSDTCHSKNWLGETPIDTAVKYQNKDIASFSAAL